MVKLGIERLAEESRLQRLLQGQRIGLLANQASVTRDFVHSKSLLKKMERCEFSCIFSPQHGFFSEKQDNMIESDHIREPESGVPVFSLYGETRKPDRAMMDKIDLLLVDLPDVGTRVYTFLYTMAYCLESAAEYGKKVVVLDRPNPVGGTQIEGNILQDDLTSFVGLYPLPMRHGMTFGELALFINHEFDVGCDLEIIEMEGWRRDMYFSGCRLPWVYPSPNMPTLETAVVYPGQVIWEGTNMSEGRGTTLPFELFGAPYLDHERFDKILAGIDLPGCFLRPLVFEPTSGKWAGEHCAGYQLHVTDRALFKPYFTSLALLQAAMSFEGFAYKQPPYEYEFEKLPLDLILGDKRIRENLEQGMAVGQIEKTWQNDLDIFSERRAQYLLYK